MTEHVKTPASSVLDRLRADRPLVAVELRPPRSGMSFSDSMEIWIDMYHSIQRLSRRDTIIFLTDNAVGQAEEENLAHLSANIGVDADTSKIVPFLTCKHPFNYCHLYAQRAASQGFEALTVLGGDSSVGPPRNVPHAYMLRRSIRERVSSLNLGGWANPHRDPAQQAAFLRSAEFGAEFYLTQVVSHHSIAEVERFIDATRRAGIEYPGVFGVFFYNMPSGLNLYIGTSSFFGMLEQKRIRAHIAELKEKGPPTPKVAKPRKNKGPSFFERLQKAAEEAQKAQPQKQKKKVR